MQINATLVKGKARVQFGANKVNHFILFNCVFGEGAIYAFGLVSKARLQLKAILFM